ncbi:MFS transporter [Saccharomonospora xinjiangensis]|uniref:Arabinose efflux permease family protein n=1 Tax=Saccharomonospora xinjiangensis XJ-54 TaxID=882086 RepID=I0V3H5_9PSEU|nr:MFS transporter [Saccharomonospora xinjiangensis]EID54678.1 arabinose efflux permease family protein [Saccharomonospora xinjiangensis XJ-54]
MGLQPYLHLFRIRALPTSMLLMLLIRMPIIASGVVLTLHVVSELGRGYGAAGLVGTATLLGTALGAPVLGRMIDRYGLRPVVAACGFVSCAYWVSSAHLPYPVLLMAALPAGALVIPAGSIARQVITALVPLARRRAAFSLDQVLLEVSYMIGPVVAIFVSTEYSTSVTLTAMGIANGVFALALLYLNPPVRSPGELSGSAGPSPTLRTWVSTKFVAALSIAMGGAFVLVGAELSAIAALRASGDVAWTGIVLAVMGAASLVGGLVYGVASRPASQLTLMVLLTVFTMPVGLATQNWWILALALVPMNVLCAPTLAATAATVSELVPHTVRGMAMGLQDSATRLGLGLGSPFVGFVLDNAEPGWGFVTAAAGGLCFAAVGAILSLRGRRREHTAATSPRQHA